MKRFARSHSLVLAGLVLVNLLVFALVAYSLSGSRHNYERRAELLAQNIAAALDQSLANRVDKIDLALRAVTDELERQLASAGQIDVAAANAMLERHAGRLPEVEAFRVADADGRVFLGPGVRPEQPVSWADRDFFVHHRTHTDRSLQISPPRLGRTSGKAIVGFAQRYAYPDGRFAGVVSAPIAVDHFAQLLARFDLGPRGVAVLRYADFSQIARAPRQEPTSLNRLGNTNVSADLRQLVGSGVPAATYHAANPMDGIDRIFAMRRLAKAPMIAIVGVASEDTLADWRQERNVTLAIAAAFVLLSSLLGAVLLRRMREADRYGAEIAARETQLRDLIEAVPDAIQLKDAAGRWLVANSVCLKLFGIVGAAWRGLSDQQIAARLPGGLAVGAPGPAHDDAAWTSGRLSRFAERTIDDQGRQHDFDIVKVPLFDERGERLAMVTVSRDVSARKANEEELEKHRHHLQQLVAERSAALADTEARASHILQASADGLFGVDEHGILTFINRAGCALLGYAPEQLVGRAIHGLIHHSRPDGTPYPAAECPTIGSLRRGATVRVDDEVFWHADGHPVPVMYATHPLLRDGRIVGAVTSFVDVAPQRAAARAREQALLAAESLDRARRELIANISHELRTPLNGILGFADIGQRAVDDPQKVGLALARIAVSGQRLLGMVNDLLDFSSLEAGSLKLEQVPWSPRQIVDRALGRVVERAAAKQLAVHCELAPDLPEHCLGDPGRVEQIVFNLLSNAVKFTDTGAIRVSVRVADDTLSIRVEDTGIGIAAAKLGDLFDPFHQLDTSATRRFGGSGLGLAIGQRLAELMGGSIRVDSQPGAGSCFELRLPCRALAEAQSALL
jgi:PAS domain S-box-containing protein